MNIDSKGDGFAMSGGRAGTVTYREGYRVLELGWELSGAPGYDIIFSRLHLKEWKSPPGESIPEEKQRWILERLRGWLAAKKIRTDIDLPRTSEVSDKECARAGCKDKAIGDSAYCQRHIDASLLGL